MSCEAVGWQNVDILVFDLACGFMAQDCAAILSMSQACSRGCNTFIIKVQLLLKKHGTHSHITPTIAPTSLPQATS